MVVYEFQQLLIQGFVTDGSESVNLLDNRTNSSRPLYLFMENPFETKGGQGLDV